MAFDATVGGTSSNSYVTLADANSYFTDRGDPADWANATDAEKQASLIYATTYIDNSMSWTSYIYSTDQALDWPRAQFVDKEGRTIGGAGVIPQKIKDSVCELALAHLKDNLNSTESENVSSESIGDASITYRGSAANRSFSFIKMNLREYGNAGSAKSNVVYRA